MLRSLVKFLFVLIVLMSPFHHANSQTLVAHTSSSSAYKNAVAFYSQSLLEELHLFNGKEYKEYLQQFASGTPYYMSSNLSEGRVNYDGQWYDNVSLLYDVAADELVYEYFNKISKIILQKDRVSAFSILDHNFIQLTRDSLASSSLAPGFYDQLYHGRMSLLVKRTKNIQSILRQSGEEFKVFSKDHYFLKKGSSYYQVSSKRNFLEVLSDKRKDLQQYIRRNKLNFKKDMENAMAKTLSYYDQLINT